MMRFAEHLFSTFVDSFILFFVFSYIYIYICIIFIFASSNKIKHTEEKTNLTHLSRAPLHIGIELMYQSRQVEYTSNQEQESVETLQTMKFFAENSLFCSHLRSFCSFALFDRNFYHSPMFKFFYICSSWSFSVSQNNLSIKGRQARE